METVSVLLENEVAGGLSETMREAIKVSKDFKGMFEPDDPRNSAAAAPAIKKEAIACVALLTKFDVDQAAQRFTSAVEAQSDEFQRCAFTSDAQASRSGAKHLFSFVYHESRDAHRTDVLDKFVYSQQR